MAKEKLSEVKIGALNHPYSTFVKNARALIRDYGSLEKRLVIANVEADGQVKHLKNFKGGKLNEVFNDGKKFWVQISSPQKTTMSGDTKAYYYYREF